jgi:drug/metabolite transporter (DMT)-like permease
MVFTGSSFSIPLRFSYLTPLLYLALPGSVIAFTAYLTLVNRIGAQRASFITVVSPLIAMTLAVLFEGETLTALNISGGVFILTANRMISIKNKKLRLCRI